MPFYVTEIVGSGKGPSLMAKSDPFRPVGWPQPGAGWIDLRPDSRVNAGHGLLFLPVAVVDPRLRKIADDPDERPSVAARTTLESVLGLTGVTRDSLPSVVFELLTTFAGGSRWKALRPSSRRRRWEIYLGDCRGRVNGRRVPYVSVPDLAGGSTFTETWPTNGTTLSSGQDQVWTEDEGDGTVVSNHLEYVSGAKMRCATALATDDHRVTCTYLVNVATLGEAACNCRIVNSATVTHYGTRAVRDLFDGTNTQLELIEAGALTTLDSEATDPGASGTMYVEADGSAIEGKAGLAAVMTATNTAITGNVRIGLRGYWRVSEGVQGDLQYDTITAEDVAAATLDMWEPRINRPERVPYGVVSY